MTKRNWTDNMLNAVSKKLGRKVSKGSINKLAAGVTPSTAKSEQQLRQLIEQVAKMAGVKVSEQTTRELIRTIRNNQEQPGNLLSLLKQMQKK